MTNSGQYSCLRQRFITDYLKLGIHHVFKLSFSNKEEYHRGLQLTERIYKIVTECPNVATCLFRNIDAHDVQKATYKNDKHPQWPQTSRKHSFPPKMIGLWRNRPPEMRDHLEIHN